MGLNRPELADNLFFGLIKPVYGPLSASTPSYWSGVEKYYPYDPKAAAALLDEAGWKPGPDGIRVKDGQRLTVHYHAISVIEPDTAVEVQAQLKKIGFDIDVEVITLAKRDEIAMNNQDNLQTLRWLSGDPSCLEVMFHSRNIPQARLRQVQLVAFQQPGVRWHPGARGRCARPCRARSRSMARRRK